MLWMPDLNHTDHMPPLARRDLKLSDDTQVSDNDEVSCHFIWYTRRLMYTYMVCVQKVCLCREIYCVVCRVYQRERVGK